MIFREGAQNPRPFFRKKTPGYQFYHLIYGLGQIKGIDAGIAWLELIALLIFNHWKKINPHLILVMGTNLFLEEIQKIRKRNNHLILGMGTELGTGADSNWFAS